ncbi:T9SS type A sorting domain-containing protein [Chryseobacterium wanjuense]
MNRKITQNLFYLMALASFCKINAQNYQTLNVTSGYNADLIANGSGAASSSTSASVDSPANGFVFMSTDFVNGSGATPTSGLPVNGLINSATTTGLPFQLAGYSSNNALRLVNTNDSGVLSFATTPKASKLYMLGTSGSGSTTATVLVTFTDGTTQTITGNIVNDWYGGTSHAIKGIGRVSRVSDAIENNANDPRLYQIPLAISSNNQLKDIASVTVTKASGAGIMCVFGFSYVVANSCIAPDTLTSSNITSNSATISWNAITGSSSYEIYSSTTNTAPTNSTAPTATGITGTTTNLTNLSSASTYYVWVRSNCGGGNTSDWSPVYTTFTTPCGAMNVPYTENFNSSVNYAIPTCTSMQAITAGSNWAVYDFTGLITGFSSKAVYTIPPTSPDANTWFYTAGINLQAGVSYTLSFNYGNYAAPQSLKVMYGTSPVNTSMTNLINDFGSVNTMVSTPATFTITPASTGVYYFGFNDYTPTNNGNAGAIAIDDISVTMATLSTSENALSNNNVSVYPTPTSDYLYIKSRQSIADAKVFDASGKMVLSLNKVEQKIDVSQLVKGTYILSIKNTDGTLSSHKFIKK